MEIKSSFSVSQPDSLRKALSMLELLQRSNNDNLIYNHVAFLLEDNAAKQSETEQLLCSLISLVLGAFSTHLAPDDTLATQIKLLQFRLMSPLSVTEHVAIQHYVENCADLITQQDEFNFQAINKTMKPLLRSFGLDNEKIFSNKQSKTASEINSILGDTDVRNILDVDVSDFGKSLRQLFSGSYLSSSIAHSEKFSVMLEVELASLKCINDPDEFELKKTKVVSELEKIMASQKEMTAYLQKMSEFVTVVEKDSIRLNEELDRVRLLSLTDELTGLPNRRAFIQQLKDEVGRANRYSLPLTLAVLDLDYFKPINDEYGHSAGDYVLRTYAYDVLPMFRAQDFVARYGGEEFVVLFPNTDIAGAVKALGMVQKRVENEAAQLNVNGIKISLPTFSAGLACLAENETLELFIQRADTALYSAKNKGRNRIEADEETNLISQL